MHFNPVTTGKNKKAWMSCALLAAAQIGMGLCAAYVLLPFLL